MAGSDNGDGAIHIKLDHLEHDISFVTRILRAHILKRNSAFYERHDAAGGEVALLSLIGLNPGLTQRDISQIVVLKKPALTKLVNEMEKNGLILRSKEGADKRLNSLHLTETGQAKLNRMRPDMAELQAGLLAPLSAAERAMLFELLWRLIEGYGGLEIAEASPRA